MTELKPCPFCSGKANLVNYGLTGRLKIVQCLDCGARTRAFDPEVKRGESACEHGIEGQVNRNDRIEAVSVLRLKESGCYNA